MYLFTSIFLIKVQGCDGAHSVTRKSLHINMVGNSTDAVWGVMDVYPRTNFPDIRKKVMIHSPLGNIIIIPREGGSLTRFYVELAAGTQASEVQLEDLQRATSSILQPYQIDFVETAWWSAYAIGQRLADKFTYKDRAFLTGDACHTHSPKAGQGMNVSLQDGHNIGWKLAAVLNGNAKPTLLETYVSERQKVAAELIAFDESWTKLFKTGNDAVTAQEVSERFIQAARYTAGLTSRYDDSAVIDNKRSAVGLGRNLKTGMRFPTTQVVRFCDAKQMQLARALPADGRWRLVVFGGCISNEGTFEALQKVCYFQIRESLANCGSSLMLWVAPMASCQT